ncbi:MAG: thiolase family protein [Calditrichaeota bacterium]|nr:MAG: thiolase family protein [Calditrichota bacterium]
MKGFHQREKGIGIVFDDIYLLNGARTPFGKFCGTLAKVSPTDLGIFAGRGALQQAGVSPSEIDQTIVANIGQASTDAYFIGRHISLYCGVPQSVPVLMVQRICASGMETVITAGEQILLNKAEVVLCCGTENMSLAPTVGFGNRMGYPLGGVVFKDMLWEALDDTAAGYPMGCTAENLAKEYHITREEVDEFAKRSQDLARAALESGFFFRKEGTVKEEILPVNSTTFEAEGLVPRKVKLPRGVENFSTDEHMRPTTLEALSKLPPSFDKEGVQTAGNSSGIVDGAAAVVVAGKNFIRLKGMQPLAKVAAATSCGVDPKVMGIGPVPAIRLLLEITGLSMEDIGLFEINEAFAAQVVACEKELGIPREKLNVHGGAIALGHPLAATGTRLALTLARSMNLRGIKYGIASACIGGGQGTAVLLENTNI